MWKAVCLCAVILFVNSARGSIFPDASGSCEKKCISSFDGAQSDACNKGCIFLIAAKNVKNPPPCTASCASRYAAYPKLITACNVGCGVPASVTFEPKALASPFAMFRNIFHQCMKRMGWNSDAPSIDNEEDSEKVGLIHRFRIFVNPFNFGKSEKKTVIAKELEEPAPFGTIHRFRIFLNPFNSNADEKKLNMMGQNEREIAVEPFHLNAHHGGHRAFQSKGFKHDTMLYILIGSGISCAIIFFAVLALLASGSRRRVAVLSSFQHRRLEEDYNPSTDVKLPIPDDDMGNSKHGTKNETLNV